MKVLIYQIMWTSMNTINNNVIILQKNHTHYDIR